MADSDFGMGYALGADSGGGSNSGGFGGMFGEGLWAIIILAMLGFGRNGFGWGGGGGYDGGVSRADLCSSFNFNNLENGVRGISQGICDSTFAVNNAITSGFHGVDSAICGLGHQISDCCCTTQRAIDGVNFNMAKGLCDLGNVINTSTRDIIESQNSGTRAILDFLVQEKLSSKDARIAALEGQLGRAEQNGVIRAAIDASTAEIIRRTGNDCPSPAYWVNPPTPVSVPYGWGREGYGGCGCGCG